MTAEPSDPPDLRLVTSAEPTVSVVIPAKNEALNLPHVLSKLPGRSTR